MKEFVAGVDYDEEGGPRFRRVKSYPKAHPLIRAIMEEVNRQRIPIKVVEKLSGVNHTAIYDWARGNHSPTIHNLIAVYTVLGLKLTLERMD